MLHLISIILHVSRRKRWTAHHAAGFASAGRTRFSSAETTVVMPSRSQSPALPDSKDSGKAGSVPIEESEGWLILQPIYFLLSPLFKLRDWICMHLITYFYLKGFAVGGFDVTFPDGTNIVYGDENAAFRGVIVVHSMRAFSRMVTGETIGMADAYMSGEWDSPDLARMVEVVAENVKARAPVGPPFQAATAQLEGFMRWLNGCVLLNARSDRWRVSLSSPCAFHLGPR